MIWWYIVAIVVTLVLASQMAKQNGPPAASIDDFSVPTCEEGRPIPVVFGTVDITGANCVWYGDLGTKKIKKGGLFGSSTIGFKYFVGFHAILSHGELDEISRITWDDKEAWSGSVTANGEIFINEPSLFGDPKTGEGGVYGKFDVMFGGATQTANTYLNTAYGPLPAFRGLTGIVWKRGTTAGSPGPHGATTSIDIGYVGNTKYVKPFAVRAKRIHKGWQGSEWYAAKAAVGAGHMNPAHIIYECLTNSVWGMGRATSEIDTVSFTAAADTFYDEGMGLSLMWNQQSEVKDFIQIVANHCACNFVFNPETEKYEIYPFRGGYDIEDLEVFDDSDIKEMTKFSRQGWGETVNEVTLQYTHPDTGKLTSITQHDLGNIAAQHKRIPKLVTLKGIRDHDLAKACLARELLSVATPVAIGKFTINQRAVNVRPGGRFRLTWPERDVEGMPCNVLSMRRNPLDNNYIDIEWNEDIYALGLYEGLSVVTTNPTPAGPASPASDPDRGPSVAGVLNTPPLLVDLYDGYRVIVGSSPTDVFVGHAGQLAEWDDTDQHFIFSDVAPGTIIYNEGTDDHIATDGSGNVTTAPWVGAVSPTTTLGDLIRRGAAIDERLPIGDEEQVLRVIAGEPEWSDQYPNGSAFQYLRLDGSLNVEWANIVNTTGQPASGARAYRNATQAVADSTLTALALTTEDFDTDAYWAIGNPSRYVVTLDGKYSFGATVQWDTDTTGIRELYVCKNGSTATRYAGVVNPASANLAQSISATLNLVAGDYLEIYVKQNSGTSRNIAGTEQITNGWIARVGSITVPRQVRGATWVRASGSIIVPVNDVHIYIPKKSIIKGCSIGTKGGIGNCVIDVWKDTTANYPPTGADTICGSTKPTISGDDSYIDTTLTGWTTTLDAGDWVVFNLVSSSTFTSIFFTLHLEEVL